MRNATGPVATSPMATGPVATSPVAMGPATPRPPSLALGYEVIRFLRCLAVIA